MSLSFKRMNQNKEKEGILSILKWAAYHENYDLFYGNI